MNVVLVFPNKTRLDELTDWWYPPPAKRRENRKVVIPLGMLYLCSSIQAHHDTVFIDNSVHRLSDDELADWCLKHEPDVVGFGGTCLEWPQASSVAGRIKSLSPKVLTVYGGPNATARPEKHVRYFDYVFRGMAEKTFDRFLCCIEQKKPPYGISGLCSKEFPKIVPPTFLQNLDDLPLPDRTKVDLDQYKRKAPGCSFPADAVIASRGCPYNCRFCSSKYIWGQHYCVRSVESVIEEILHMKETYGSRTIYFREDNFTVNKKRLLQFCSALKELNVDWLCQSRVGGLDEDTVHIMKESGCKYISCGFESINDSTLQYMRKGQTADQVIQTINTFEKVGIAYTGAFMVATPNEGKDEILNTLKFVKKVSLFRHSKIPNTAVRFVGIPLSEMYNEILRDGLVEFDWQEGELLFPRTHQLNSKEVDAIIADFQDNTSLVSRFFDAQTRFRSRIAARTHRIYDTLKRRASTR